VLIRSVMATVLAGLLAVGAASCVGTSIRKLIPAAAATNRANDGIASPIAEVAIKRLRYLASAVTGDDESVADEVACCWLKLRVG
jgi:hypothetical protein